MILEPETVARGWIDLQSDGLDECERALSAWADEVIYAAIHNDTRYALRIIDAIHEMDADQAHVEVFAAGPLENLIAWQGEVVMDEIEIRAGRDTKFAHALGGVWRRSIPENIWERIKACRDSKNWDSVMD